MTHRQKRCLCLLGRADTAHHHSHGIWLLCNRAQSLLKPMLPPSRAQEHEPWSEIAANARQARKSPAQAFLSHFDGPLRTFLQLQQGIVVKIAVALCSYGGGGIFDSQMRLQTVIDDLMKKTLRNSGARPSPAGHGFANFGGVRDPVLWDCSRLQGMSLQLARFPAQLPKKPVRASSSRAFIAMRTSKWRARLQPEKARSGWVCHPCPGQSFWLSAQN